MPDKYQIKITLNDDTLRKLYRTDQSLRVYKGVRGTVAGGFSTVWFTTNNFAGTVILEWKQEYGAYFCHNELKPGIVTGADNFENIERGNLMTVRDDGTCVITRGDDDRANIAIRNKGKKEGICGIGALVRDKMSPLCALPLFGKDLREIEPLEKVLLEFDYGTLPAGTTVEKVWLKSIIINFAKTKEKQVVVSYDINTGWSAQNAAWAKITCETIEIAKALNEPVARK